MAKQHKDTIIAHLEIEAMALKSHLHDVNEMLKYISEKGLIKDSEAGILSQTIKMYIEIGENLIKLPSA